MRNESLRLFAFVFDKRSLSVAQDVFIESELPGNFSEFPQHQKTGLRPFETAQGREVACGTDDLQGINAQYQQTQQWLVTS